MNTEKRFTLSFPDFTSFLTCDLRGAQYLPGALIVDARLGELVVGETSEVFIHDQLYYWERIA